MRGGVVGILLIGGVLYFTSAGNVMWRNLQGLNGKCYSALSAAGPAIADPVCKGMAQAFDGIESAAQAVGDTVQAMRQRIFSTHDVSSFAEGMRDSLASISSSKERLAQLMGSGPTAFGVASSSPEQFQRAIDQFTIGQSYMDKSNVEGALPWFQQSANQPNGYGLMSQLTLGNLYMQGGRDMPPNAVVAEAYLAQARNSLNLLMGSRSPQAQQLLQALPQSPQETQVQIDQMLRKVRR